MYERFVQLLNLHHTNANKVAKDLSIAPSTLSDWKKGKSIPKLEKLRRIADYFKVPIGYFIDEQDEKAEDNIKKSDNISRILDYDATAGVPVIGEIHAGAPVITNEIIEGYEMADVDNSEEFYYLNVRGDSMINAGIVPGSLVLIHRQNFAESGQIVVCMTDEESATLKRFEIDGDSVRLCPENDAYEPIVLHLRDFVTGKARILGIAVEVRIKL
jgi:repressor LexA